MKLLTGDWFATKRITSSYLILIVLIITVDLSYSFNTDIKHETVENRSSLYACQEFVVEENQSLFISSAWTKSGKNLTFSLKSDFEKCNADSFAVLFKIENHTLRESQKTVNKNIDVNGVLRLGNDFYHPYEYCVYDWKSDLLTLKICNATCQGMSPCISKCCSIGKAIDYVKGEGCVDDPIAAPVEWSPKLYENPHEEVSLSESLRIKPHIRYNPIKCTFPNGTFNPEPELETLPSVDVPKFELLKMSMRLRKDGSLLYLGKLRSWDVLPWNSFCIDYILVDGNTEESSENNMVADRPVVVLKCAQSESRGRLSLFYVVAMFTSAFFLALTAIVYAMLWDKHNIHGWTILCHVISMFFLYVLLGLSHAFGLFYEFDDFIDTTSCMAIGVAVHFFFVSTFCWLTLINFDLWATFRSLTPVGERSKGVKKFVLYNVFAWGVAVVVVTVGILMDHLYPDVDSEVIVPQYGQTNCFMALWAMGYYVYSIIGALMIINFVFIFLTIWTIYSFRETTRMIQHSKSGGPLQSFKLFSKLFVIMGVTWVLEIVSWLTSGVKTTIHWTVLDCVNIFQAIAIFVIFICKHKTVVQLQQKFPICDQKWSCCGNSASDDAKMTNSSDQSTGTTGINSKQHSAYRNTIEMKSTRA